MDDITQQQIQERFPTLPEVIREALSDSRTFEIIEKVGKSKELTRVEIGLLAQTTSLLMMGFISPNGYVAALIDQLSIPREKAAFIAQEINRDVFNPIKEELKQIHQVVRSPAVTSTPVTPSTPPLSPPIPAAVATPPATPSTPSPAPITPPKPVDPLYPSFLEQIKQSTPPYISSSFPGASPKPQGVATPQPTQSSSVSRPIIMTNVFQTPAQPTPASMPQVIPPSSPAPVVAVTLPPQPPVQFPPIPQPLPTSTPAPATATPLQYVAPSMPAPVSPAPVILAAFVQPAPVTASQILPSTPFVQPTAQMRTAAQSFIAPLPQSASNIVQNPLVVPTQTIVPPPVVAPVFTAPPPPQFIPPVQSPESAQNTIAIPTPPQNMSTFSQPQMQKTEQDMASAMPAPTAPVWPTSAVMFTPTTEPSQLPPTQVSAPAPAMPIQYAAPSLPVPPPAPPVAPVIPAAFVQPAPVNASQTFPPAQFVQPVMPPTSAFEQKMSGAFVVKSDVPNYSAPTPAQVVPQPQPYAIPQVLPSQNPAAAPQGDAYREPIA